MASLFPELNIRAEHEQPLQGLLAKGLISLTNSGLLAKISAGQIRPAGVFPFGFGGQILPSLAKRGRPGRLPLLDAAIS